MEKEFFSEIPLKTWNWLGVNEIKTHSKIEEKIIEVKAGEVQKITELNLSNVETAKKIKFIVGDSAKIEFISVDLGESDFASDIEIDLVGDNSSAEINAVYFGDGSRKLDLNYVIHQRGKKTNANMNIKGAITDKCDKIFRGTLDFVQGSSGSVGREFEEVILLSDEVRNRSVPIMLSHEDEVDGHHAVSVGRLDEDKIFYLMSRGLDKSDAERLIIETAFNPVIEKIEDEKTRTTAYEILKNKLSANQG